MAKNPHNFNQKFKALLLYTTCGNFSYIYIQYLVDGKCGKHKHIVGHVWKRDHTGTLQLFAKFDLEPYILSCQMLTRLWTDVVAKQMWRTGQWGCIEMLGIHTVLCDLSIVACSSCSLMMTATLVYRTIHPWQLGLKPKLCTKTSIAIQIAHPINWTVYWPQTSASIASKI